MAKPTKRRVEGGRVTPKGTRPAGSTGATNPRFAQQHQTSPRWVPFVMFGLLGLGILVIIANYTNLLPGDANQGYLLLGLGLILGGIITATKLH